MIVKSPGLWPLHCSLTTCHVIAKPSLEHTGPGPQLSARIFHHSPSSQIPIHPPITRLSLRHQHSDDVMIAERVIKERRHPFIQFPTSVKGPLRAQPFLAVPLETSTGTGFHLCSYCPALLRVIFATALRLSLCYRSLFFLQRFSES